MGYNNNIHNESGNVHLLSIVIKFIFSFVSFIYKIQEALSYSRITSITFLFGFYVTCVFITYSK